MNLRPIAEIDRDREAAGLTRKALYTRAGIHHATYGRTLKGATVPSSGTLQALETALAALLAERQETAG